MLKEKAASLAQWHRKAMIEFSANSHTHNAKFHSENSSSR